MAEVYWNSDIFVAEPYEKWIEGQAAKNVKEKLESILKKNFPPKAVINDKKLEKINEIMRTFIDDENLFNTFQKDLEKIVG